MANACEGYSKIRRNFCEAGEPIALARSLLNSIPPFPQALPFVRTFYSTHCVRLSFGDNPVGIKFPKQMDGYLLFWRLECRGEP